MTGILVAIKHLRAITSTSDNATFVRALQAVVRARRPSLRQLKRKLTVISSFGLSCGNLVRPRVCRRLVQLDGVRLSKSRRISIALGINPNASTRLVRATLRISCSQAITRVGTTLRRLICRPDVTTCTHVREFVSGVVCRGSTRGS